MGVSSGRRVVITGLGLLTPAGHGAQASWEGMVRGISPATCAGPGGGIAAPIVASVCDFDPTKFLGEHKHLKLMARSVQLGLSAAKLALEESRIELDRLDPMRVGVYVGSGGPPQESHDFFATFPEPVAPDGRVDTSRFGIQGYPFENPFFLLISLSNTGIFFISVLANAKGPNNNFVNTDTSSAQAIGEAARSIQRGEADLIVAGGYDSPVSAPLVAAYRSAGLLSGRIDDPPGAMRPFDRERDGMVLGEGAGMVVLEEWEHARARGAPLYAEVVGYASAFDPYDLTRPSPSGAGMSDALQRALSDASLAPERVDYVCAHGDATREGDLAEVRALKAGLGPRAWQVPVSSIKPITGYCGAASGAVEAIACALAITRGLVPPTANWTTPDPECDLDWVPGGPRNAAVEVAVSLNRGFGGQVAALVLKRVG